LTATRFLLSLVLALLLPVAFVQAQDQQPPQPPPQQQQPVANRYLPEKPTYGIFVFGDGLAGGLQAGMARLTEQNDRFRVDGRFKEDSGLARPEIYDWNEAIPKIFRSNEIDVVVMFAGMNDVQTIKDQNFRYAFGAPEWMTAYATRIDQLLATLKQTGAAIYWVGLPPMEAEDYDKSIAAIAAIQKARVEAAGLRYIDIKPAFADSAGKFIERGPDDTGEVRRLRDRDGIHFMRVGNNKLASLVLAAITKDVEGAPPPTAAVPAGEGQAATEAPGAGPSFGQDATEGVAGVVRTQPAPGATAADKPAASAAIAPNAEAVAKSGFAQGTAAYELFVKGVPPKPVQGRFDDFSYSEPQ
jgi:hypothetical protein